MVPSLSATQEVHSEDRELIEQLAKLQNMHGQIHGLRGLLPERLLKPTKAVLENPSRSSPAKLATNLRDTAMQGSKDIRQFSSDFRSESMQQLWQKTSSADFPQGRDAWTVDYETLLKSAPSTNAPLAAPSNGTEAASKKEDISEVLKIFKDANPTIKVESPESSSTFPLDITVGELGFRVNQEESAGKQVFHLIEQPGNTSDLASAVITSINIVGAQSSLAILLSMLAAYKDLKFQPCQKCHTIFDSKMMYPVVRRRKPASDKDDTSIQWSALHRDCTS